MFIDSPSSLTSQKQFSKIKKTRIPWWVIIQTNIPYCTYYFGPFNSAKEAQLSQYGYLEDLMDEKAHGISVQIKQSRPPQVLTLYED
jgi:hypothetical protein